MAMEFVICVSYFGDVEEMHFGSISEAIQMNLKGKSNGWTAAIVQFHRVVYDH